MTDEDTEGTRVWKKYQSQVCAHIQERASQCPSFFAQDRAQRCYGQCLEVPIPLEHMPLLRLPIRVNIIRNDFIGCSSDLNRSSIESIVRLTNSYWTQVGIRFELTSVLDRDFVKFESPEGGAFPPSQQRDVRDFIDTQLIRGADGKIRNKDRRADVFLGSVLKLFRCPREDEDDDDDDDDDDSCSIPFDVWFFDMIGQESQGCCIDRRARVIIMGERSTKGYVTPTKRPHRCLAKTMAHELGHALGLGHPRGRKFSDGRSQIFTVGRRNLMQGGSDAKGGGGDHLEQWQICLCRETAEELIGRSGHDRSGR